MRGWRWIEEIRSAAAGVVIAVVITALVLLLPIGLGLAWQLRETDRSVAKLAGWVVARLDLPATVWTVRP